jgi:hypothetical protein
MHDPPIGDLGQLNKRTHILSHADFIHARSGMNSVIEEAFGA